MRWLNFTTLKNAKDSESMARIINENLPKNVKVIRIHSSGDFFNKEYFNAWVKVCELNPGLTVYGYTKILDYVKADKPINFKLVYSIGGIDDNKLSGDVPSCKVILKNELTSLPIICANKTDESHAEDYNYILSGESFGLNLH
jgi:hypothetical protein